MIQSARLARLPAVKTEVAYAGFWRRLLAYLIDALVLGAIEFTLGVGAYLIAPGDIRAFANVAPVSAAVAWAYFALLESSPARGTLGKIALELYVGDAHGDPITFRRATARYLLKTLSTLLLGTGWLMAAFTPRKQALHDVLAGTLVLRRVHLLVIGPEPPSEPGDYWDGSRWVASVSPLERT
ncbi:MAG: RDD family protein [Chloroflexi bacterium]|nr:MAG: RDD family protein [Chloroflexota bacterium]